jgi:hypothetical protein
MRQASSLPAICRRASPGKEWPRPDGSARRVEQRGLNGERRHVALAQQMPRAGSRSRDGG